MLKLEESKKLSEVGPGTFMGELLRRYWHPIAAVGELDKNPVKPVKLLGESLVLYRDRRGTLGLLDKFCAHRSANLILGIPEDEGLRCHYHGWRYDETGQCLEQPAERRPFCAKIKLKAYPVRVACGAIFAYLGPKPVPELPIWDLMAWDNVEHEIGYIPLPCNWLQSMENAPDIPHIPMLHGRFHNYVLERVGRPDLKKRMWRPGDNNEDQIQSIAEHSYDRNELGILLRYTQTNKSRNDPDWRIGRQIIFPLIERAANDLEIRVPVDDTNMIYFCIRCHWLPPGEKSNQKEIPYYRVPYAVDKDENVDWTALDGNGMQDTACWATMGPNVDRTKEMLGDSDRGVVLYRQMLKEQGQIVADGGDPMNVFRDPEKAKYIHVAAPEEEHYWEYQEDQQLSRARSFNKYSPIMRERVTKILGEEALSEPCY